MKTTLNIDDGVMRELKREAASRGCTTSELVETAVRALLRPSKRKKQPKPLPTFDGGKELVDISDRDALYKAMGGR